MTGMGQLPPRWTRHPRNENCYYYHWLVDTDNNPATGRINSYYEGIATNLETPIADRVIQFGWRDGVPTEVCL